MISRIKRNGTQRPADVVSVIRYNQTPNDGIAPIGRQMGKREEGVLRVNRDRFAQVIKYLSGFSTQETNVLFTPKPDGQVLASVDAGESYAQYIFDVDEPLQERFSTRLYILRRISEVAGEGDIVYRLGSQTIWTSDGAKWRVPPVILKSIKPREPWVPVQWIYWDNSLLKWLGIMRQSTMQRVRSGSLDSVLISTQANSELVKNQETGETRIKNRTSYRVIVASDMATMVTYEEKDIDCDHTASLLIDRHIIPQFIATCESGSRIEIKIGVSQFSVTCGRRMATFGLRNGIYPKWQDVVKDARERDSKGSAKIDRLALGGVIRQAGVASSALKVSSHQTLSSQALQLVSAHDDQERSDQTLNTSVDGRFGPIILSTNHLKRLANHWPADELSLEYQGKDHAIVVRSEETPHLMGLINPMKPGWKEVEIDEWPSENEEDEVGTDASSADVPAGVAKEPLGACGRDGCGRGVRTVEPQLTHGSAPGVS